MRKAYFLILLSFFFAVKYSFSAEEAIFSDTVYSKDIEEIEGSQFEFIVIEDYVSIKIGTSIIAVKRGECEISDKFNICVSNVTLAYRNSTTWENFYKALVKIFLIKPEIKVTKNIKKTEILVGEESDIELIIENIGNIAAENVITSEKYPDEILVKEAEGCNLDFGEITFKGNLNPSQIRKCKYKIKGLKPIVFNSGLSGNYFDGFETKNITLNKTITVLNYSLEIKFSIIQNVSLGADLEIPLTLKNINKDNELKVSIFTLSVPSGFRIENHKGLQKNNNLLLWSGKIRENTEQNFTLTLKAVKTGKQLFNAEASYEIADFFMNINQSYHLQIICDCPFIDYKIGNFVSGFKTDFSVAIKNPSNIAFSNLKINHITNIPEINNFSGGFEKISKNSSTEFLEQRIINPGDQEEFYFNMTLFYKSPFNEYFVRKKSIKISLPENTAGNITLGNASFEIEVQSEESEEILDESQEIQKNETQNNNSNTIEKINDSKKSQDNPVILANVKKSVPFRALSVVLVIFAILVLFMTFKVFKMKKENE